MSMWSFQELIYPNEMDFEEFADYCVTRKIKYVELLDFFVLDKLEETLEIMQQKGLEPAVWSICNDFVQPDEGKRQEQIDYVCKQIDVAKRIGVDRMRIFSGDVKAEVSFEEGIASIKKCLPACVSYAQEKGITLCLENHGVFAATSEQVKELLDSINSPALRSNFDTANFLFVEEEPVHAAEELSGYVGLLHLKDYRLSEKEGEGWATEFKKIWYTGCPLGQGAVPLARIFERLQQGGFDGIASIELESPDPLNSADESLRFLRRVEETL